MEEISDMLNVFINMTWRQLQVRFMKNLSTLKTKDSFGRLQMGHSSVRNLAKFNTLISSNAESLIYVDTKTVLKDILRTDSLKGLLQAYFKSIDFWIVIYPLVLYFIRAKNYG